MKEIQLVGAGGLAKDIIACFKNQVVISGIWDDALSVKDLCYDIPVLGKISDIPFNHPIDLVIAVGNPSTRALIYNLLLEKQTNLPSLVHDSAMLFDSPHIHIGQACILMPFTYLTSHIRIEENGLLHIGCGIHHDVTLQAHSVLMPGAKITCAFISPPLFFLDSNNTLTYKDLEKHKQ